VGIAPLPVKLPPRSITSVCSRQSLSQRLQEILQDISSCLLTDEIKIASEIEQLKPEAMLLPHTLMSESGIVENPAKIQGYGEVLEPSMAISRMAMFEMERRVTNLAANGFSDAEFLRGLKHDLSRGARNSAERVAQTYTSQKRTTAALT
jgi:hypothetical protein